MENEIIEVELSTQELINQKYSELLNISSELKATDYIALKELDGEDVSKYGDYKLKRRNLRELYNQIENELKDYQDKLNNEDINDQDEV